MANLNEDLDVLGSQPLLHNLYTQITFCFPVADPSLHPKIISTLTSGLERLSKSFPWLAGQVSEVSPALFKICPYKSIPELTVNDLRNSDYPPWNELKAAGFPFSMLDENIICSRTTLPDPTAEVSPVLLLQLNWVEGGLLLSVIAAHSCTDMTGQAHIIHLLSKACYGEDFTDEEIADGNPDRANIVPLLDGSYKPGPELDNQLIKQPESQPEQIAPSAQVAEPAPSMPPPMPNCSWAYITFSASSLVALKKLASTTLPSGTPFVSTDDVLTAFLWQRISHARSSRLPASQTVRFARAVDARSYLNVSPTYPGLLQNMTYNATTLSSLLASPLGAVAADFRRELDAEDIRFRTQSLATYIRTSKESPPVSFAANIAPSSDIMLSSWAKVNCYSQDFNFGLGKPVSVRRPSFFPVEGLCYLMPKAQDGEIAAALCLRDEDLEVLRGNEEVGRYGVYVG
ncbi:putative trichothecene 3-O-acetyltransferase [Lophiotrema nucula]|uniref:Putative trichothecene 3-O-acetyltransferase n=1 Tax=Lophiotrema nucula TaxID=690887 RepID=A0A6A5YP19_9PLEO|nr:putative trichothecene 3-O-acetyltransferase [Lophiotrema nucula]